ncbi:immunoglobulin lambda-1 light chain isoform X3 [Oncorhynchus kisutch]|uniref:Immunoglobulin lambda-1 light chain-like n=1 Tax=Oncorhynchus kisutch TaxID=8019 RepID=A0A8C7N1X7_ONCKI|nr:immunoglobulin lambda-1 light chain-like isoform X2 [Oncorhynchus kisutch]XP_031674017.1 immunoglobulin lambda-1 light chain-like isoform X3 [Oncorhynchus kisutch]
MLGTLCTLITALTYVSCQKAVTQTPSVLTVSTKGTATFHCDITKDESKYVIWYKQVPGGAPQYVLRFYRTHGSPNEYGSGFSSDRFTSKATSDKDYQFIISNVEETDSAVYYCHTWDDSVKVHVFGQGTKLIVTDSTLPPPVLTILPPSSDELKSSKVTLVCLASQMAMGYADVSWTAGGNPVTGGIATSGPVPQADKTFQLSSCLTVDTSEWNQDKVFSCKVTAGSKFAEKGIKKSECSTE